MSTIKADRGTCQGYGNCAIAFPAAFDVDDEGLVVQKQDHVDESELEAAQRAAYDCPTDSIKIGES
jgi:ferredoxin